MTSVVDVTLAVAPTLTGTVANQATLSEAPIAAFAGVTVGDVNAGATETLAITLSGGGGTLSGAGSAVNGVYTLTGTATAVTKALDAVVFTAAVGSPGTSAATTLTLSDVSSAYATPVVDRTTSVIDTDPSVSSLTLRVAEDAYQGDAQFQVYVDGKAVGALQTATASRALGQWQNITVSGVFDANPSSVAVQFVNDAYAGPGQDRNLYIQSVTVDGTTVPGAAAVLDPGVLGVVGDPTILYDNGAARFAIPSQSATSGSDTLMVIVQEDAYNGNAEYLVRVDGVVVGGVQTATASHASGSANIQSFSGNFAGAKEVSVQFVNDAYASPSQDRNLYVYSVVLDGRTALSAAAIIDPSVGRAGTPAVLDTNGAAVFDFRAPTVRVSEDAYQGDAQFQLYADGQAIGGLQTVTASHALGQWQYITVGGTLPVDPASISVQFVNDLYAGPNADRNLYIQSVSVDGTTISGATAVLDPGVLGVVGDPTILYDNGAARFDLASQSGTSGPDTLTLLISEDAYKGDAEFVVRVDGEVVGGVETAHATNGNYDTVTLQGDFAGAKQVSVQYVNDVYSGGSIFDRNLYVKSVNLDGTVVSGSAATIDPAVGRAGVPAVLFTNGAALFNIPSSSSTTSQSGAVASAAIPSTALLSSYMAVAPTTASALLSDATATPLVAEPVSLTQPAHA